MTAPNGEPGATPDGVPDGPLELDSRITEASNATFLGLIGETQVVYKPTMGEQPLWDFPDHTLAQREVASYLLSEALRWNVVPPTWLREGPFGTGMVQLWQEIDRAQDPVDLVAAEDLNERSESGWRHVLDGLDAHDQPVSLIHEDSPELRRMAVFDILANNADRKAGHILPMPGGHRFGVDHGLTFHTSHRLRTVLWGWVGEPLQDGELADVRRIRDALDGDLGEQLEELLSLEEIVALSERCDLLLETAGFPAPRGGMPAVPCPLF